jgi:Zn-dependent peptidase ImmA (M78 family)
MIDASPSLEAAKGISGRDLLAYLNAQGWTAQPSKVDGIMILSKKVGEPDQRAEFIVPIKAGFSDEEKRIADALRAIAQIQGRSEAQIAESIKQQASGPKPSEPSGILASIHKLIDILNDRKIESAARRLRKSLGLSDQNVFNIVELLENEMPKAIDHFRLEVVAARENPEVYSTSEPPRIFATEDIYRLAQQGDAKSRFIFAHEIGHVFLHSSTSHFRYLKTAESAEWQASKFAMIFLMPDSVARRFKDPAELSKYCKVERQVAELRMDYLHLGKDRTGNKIQQLRSRSAQGSES